MSYLMMIVGFLVTLNAQNGWWDLAPGMDSAATQLGGFMLVLAGAIIWEIRRLRR